MLAEQHSNVTAQLFHIFSFTKDLSYQKKFQFIHQYRTTPVQCVGSVWLSSFPRFFLFEHPKVPCPVKTSNPTPEVIENELAQWPAMLDPRLVRATNKKEIASSADASPCEKTFLSHQKSFVLVSTQLN